MRNLLFWLSLIFLIFIGSVSIGLAIAFNLIDLNSLPSDQILFPTLIYIIFSIGCSFVISLFYTRIIAKINDSIETPYLVKELYLSKLLPSNIKKILLAIQKQQSIMNDMRAELKAEKYITATCFETMTDGLIITDQEGKIASINNAALKIFSIYQQNSIGYSLAEALRNHKINELWEKCASSKQVESTQFETTPGRSFIQCIATPLDPELPGKILFIFQDQTRMRQLEVVRRDFVSNVSHELRTPLTSLKLITDTLKTSAMDDPDATKLFIERMDGEVDNLTQMVEELLELSRIESGRVPLEKQWVNPCTLIKQNCERMQLQAQRAGLDLSINCEDNLPDIYIDPVRLGRVLVNLIHNAIKFTPPGGHIKSDVRRDSDILIFSVEDTGIGIPQKDLKRIFERFFKGDPSRSNQGTGLGLSISKHIVESHDGTIWAESKPTGGSKIQFSIPINQQI